MKWSVPVNASCFYPLDFIIGFFYEANNRKIGKESVHDISEVANAYECISIQKRAYVFCMRIKKVNQCGVWIWNHIAGDKTVKLVGQLFAIDRNVQNNVWTALPWIKSCLIVLHSRPFDRFPNVLVCSMKMWFTFSSDGFCDPMQLQMGCTNFGTGLKWWFKKCVCLCQWDIHCAISRTARKFLRQMTYYKLLEFHFLQTLADESVNTNRTSLQVFGFVQNFSPECDEQQSLNKRSTIRAENLNVVCFKAPVLQPEYAQMCRRIVGAIVLVAMTGQSFEILINITYRNPFRTEADVGWIGNSAVCCCLLRTTLFIARTNVANFVSVSSASAQSLDSLRKVLSLSKRPRLPYENMPCVHLIYVPFIC